MDLHTDVLSREDARVVTTGPTICVRSMKQHSAESGPHNDDDRHCDKWRAMIGLLASPRLPPKPQSFENPNQYCYPTQSIDLADSLSQLSGWLI
jgi:hypothetical protein